MSAAAGTLKQTPLHSVHTHSGAKMVDFAGWDMPVFYRSILEEHKAVRRGAGMFDVSHMGQIFVSGKESGQFLNAVFTNEILSAPVGAAIYTHMLNEQGGVIDDVIVYRLTDKTDLIVANASRIEADWNWLKRQSERFQVSLNNESPNFGIIALQGPLARKIAAPISARAAQLHRFSLCQTVWKGHELIIAGTGYTGEDGFEFICPNEALAQLWDALLDAARKENAAPFSPCGLGARDTLRLEAGFPLWGHELGENITPLEAGYGWVVKWQKDFIGKAALVAQKQKGLERKIFGFLGLAPGPLPRAEAAILTEDGKEAGVVTSGTFSPTLAKPIAAGFLRKEFWTRTEFKIGSGERLLPAVLTPLPFYKASKV